MIGSFAGGEIIAQEALIHAMPPQHTGRAAAQGSETESAGFGGDAVSVNLSAEAQAAGGGRESGNGTRDESEDDKATRDDPTKVSLNPEQDLSQEEQEQLDQMKETDRKVRAHEAAHMAAGGGYTSPASFEYDTGPDGQQYAIGGEVQIDSSPVPGDPQATIAKMDVVIRAALAPSDPSPQDRAVATEAQQKKMEALAELQQQRGAEARGEGDSEEPGPAANENSPEEGRATTGPQEQAEGGLNNMSSLGGDRDSDDDPDDDRRVDATTVAAAAAFQAAAGLVGDPQASAQQAFGPLGVGISV